jgi:hypothetical protein
LLSLEREHLLFKMLTLQLALALVLLTFLLDTLDQMSR